MLGCRFRRDPGANNCPAAPAKLSSGEIPWSYDRSEIVADGIVHGAGVILGLAIWAAQCRARGDYGQGPYSQPRFV
jgi:hypothetical protein